MIRLAALLALAALWTVPASAVDPFDPFDAATIVDRPGAQIPVDAPFRDAEGRTTTLRAIADGRPMLLVPVLHECPNICGATLSGLASAVAEQRYRAGRDFAVVAFGIDPAEGPGDARADMARLAAQNPGHGLSGAAWLTGEEDSIRAVTDALGYRYAWDERIGQYAHASATAVLTPDGRLTRWLYGVAPDPGDLAAAVEDARAGRTGGFLERLILLCYHYDPETGRYSLIVTRAVQIAGLLTVLLLGGLILFLRRRSP